jgi:hypothetical protein
LPVIVVELVEVVATVELLLPDVVDDALVMAVDIVLLVAPGDDDEVTEVCSEGNAGTVVVLVVEGAAVVEVVVLEVDVVAVVLDVVVAA